MDLNDWEIDTSTRLIAFHKRGIKWNKALQWSGFVLLLTLCIFAYYYGDTTWLNGMSVGVNIMTIAFNLAEEVNNKNEIKIHNARIAIYTAIKKQLIQ